MTMVEVPDDELPIDIDLISVHSYENSVVISFVDKEGEHGAILTPSDAKSLARSLLNAVNVANTYDEEGDHVN
jgi:hypothetical protein